MKDEEMEGEMESMKRKTDSWKKTSEFKKLKHKSYRIDTIFFLFNFQHKHELRNVDVM